LTDSAINSVLKGKNSRLSAEAKSFILAELAQALLERDRIFNFIQKIENEEVRELALRFYINGESWEEIARANGQPGHATSYRVQLHRYLKSFTNQT
jgi:hypothetical protein